MRIQINPHRFYLPIRQFSSEGEARLLSSLLAATATALDLGGDTAFAPFCSLPDANTGANLGTQSNFTFEMRGPKKGIHWYYQTHSRSNNKLTQNDAVVLKFRKEAIK